MGTKSITVPILALTILLPLHSSAQGSELDDLQQIVDAVSGASIEMKLPLLAAGFEEVSRVHGWDLGACGDAWKARSRAQREDPTQGIAAAYPGCEAMCPRGALDATARAVVGTDPRERTAVLVAACDAEGPEPVFTGDLSPLRAQMSFTDYWAYRSMYAMLFARLDEIGGERAAAVRTAHEGLLVSVARDLARHLPPRLEGLTLPVTTAGRPPLQGSYPHILITTDEIAVDGTTVCRLEGGVVPSEALSGAEIASLLQLLEPRWEVEDQIYKRDVHPSASFHGTFLVQADEGVLSGTLLQVIETAAKARFGEVGLAGYNPELGHQTRIGASLPAPNAGFGGGMDPPPLDLTVSITSGGIFVEGNSPALADPAELPRKDGVHDVAGLAALCVRVKADHPYEDLVTLAPAADVPYRDLMAVLDAARGAATEQGWRESDLFSLVVLQPPPRP